MWGTDRNFCFEGHSLASRAFAEWCQTVTQETEILSVRHNYDRYFFFHTIHLLIYLFHVIKCIQCVGFAIISPR